MFVVSASRQPWTPRRRYGVVAAVALAAASVTGGLVLTPLPKASSQIAGVRTEVGVDRQGWYWSENQRVAVPGTGVQQELFPAPAQQHHLQVSLASGEEDKRAYVGFDVLFLQGFTGGTVRSFSLSVDISPPTTDHANEHGQQAQESQTPPIPPSTINDESARLVACPVTSFLADGADGDPMQDLEGNRIEPEFDCREGTAEGNRSADGARWTFDLTAAASLWASGETSDAAVVLKPAPDAASPPAPESTWIVELHGRQLDGFTATMSYTPAGGELTPLPPPPIAGAPTTSTTTIVEPGTPATAPTEPPPEPEVAAPPSAPLGEPQPRYPWYAFLPWIGGALALGLAYYALRDAPRGAMHHRVADLLRTRRLGEVTA